MSMILQDVLRQVRGLRRVSVLFKTRGEAVDRLKLAEVAPSAGSEAPSPSRPSTDEPATHPTRFPFPMPPLVRLSNYLRPDRGRWQLLQLLKDGPDKEARMSQKARSPAQLLRVGLELGHPDPEVLQAKAGYLIHQSMQRNSPECLAAVLAYLNKSQRVELAGTLYSKILSAMGMFGWYWEMKETFFKMAERGTSLRLETFCSLLASSVSWRDFGFALELMVKLMEVMGGMTQEIRHPRDFPLETMAEKCVWARAGEKGVELLKLVLKLYDMREGGVDRETVEVFVRWIQR